VDKDFTFLISFLVFGASLLLLVPAGRFSGVTLTQLSSPSIAAEISARLGIPVGSIGPMRRRCLDKLRRHPAIAVLITAEAGTGRPSNPVAKTLPFCS